MLAYLSTNSMTRVRFRNSSAPASPVQGLLRGLLQIVIRAGLRRSLTSSSIHPSKFFPWPHKADLLLEPDTQVTSPKQLKVGEFL